MKTPTATITVVATREDNRWLAQVPDLPGVQTWAKNLHGLDKAVREAIALSLDLPDGAEADLDLTFDYQIGDADTQRRAKMLRHERQRLRAAEAQLMHHTEEVARTLAKDLSVRDIAQLLGITAQRVSQIAPKG